MEMGGGQRWVALVGARAVECVCVGRGAPEKQVQCWTTAGQSSRQLPAKAKEPRTSGQQTVCQMQPADQCARSLAAARCACSWGVGCASRSGQAHPPAAQAADGAAAEAG